MAAIVVGLVIQIVWRIIDVVAQQHGVAALDPRLFGFSFAIVLATDLVIAAGAASLARRLRGMRALGAYVAAGAFAVSAATFALAEGFLHTVPSSVVAHLWMRWMADYGWIALQLLSIIGFAMAAGRRGAWLALPAAGVTLLQARPRILEDAWPSAELLGIVAVSSVLITLMASEAERVAIQPEPAGGRAIGGVRRAEITAWVVVGLSAFGFVRYVVDLSSPYWVLGWSGALVAVDLVVVSAVWSIVASRVAQLPRWPWCVTGALFLWAACYATRLWFVTLARYGLDLDQLKFGPSHWWGDMPVLLAMLAAFVSLAIYARRTDARELARATVAGGAFLVLVMVVRIAIPEERLVVMSCYIAANLAAARVYRATRHALEGPLPRARVV